MLELLFGIVVLMLVGAVYFIFCRFFFEKALPIETPGKFFETLIGWAALTFFAMVCSIRPVAELIDAVKDFSSKPNSLLCCCALAAAIGLGIFALLTKRPDRQSGGKYAAVTCLLFSIIASWITDAAPKNSVQPSDYYSYHSTYSSSYAVPSNASTIIIQGRAWQKNKIVWYTAAGKSFHYNSTCYHIRDSKKTSGTISAAVASGHGDPCDDCCY